MSDLAEKGGPDLDYEPLNQSGDPIDTRTARRIVEQFLFDGWNSHDPDRVLVCVTPDVVWSDPFIPGGIAHGHEAAREWLISMWKMAPETIFELIDEVYLSTDGTKIAAPWRISGTGMVGLDLYELRGELISRVRTMVALSLAQAEQVGG